LSAQEERALAKGLVFELDVPEVIGDTFGDGTRLLKMVQGLVEDSIEATGEGFVAVSVSYAYPSSGDIVVRVEVMDSGEVVSMSEQGNSFGAMVALDSPKKIRTREMGLFLCKKIATAMGGSMGLQARVGGGAQVWFEVRLRRGVQCSTSGQRMKEGCSKDKLAKKTVLVVDDNPISRKVIVKHLHVLGLHVEVTGSGYAALELMKTQPYDLAVLDLGVCDVGAEDIASCLRDSEGKAPPLFGMVPQADTVGPEGCLDIGVSALIKKPLDPQLLKEMVVGALG
jgi:CheY-like chemotaxis protein